MVPHLNPRSKQRLHVTVPTAVIKRTQRTSNAKYAKQTKCILSTRSQEPNQEQNVILIYKRPAQHLNHLSKLLILGQSTMIVLTSWSEIRPGSSSDSASPATLASILPSAPPGSSPFTREAFRPSLPPPFSPSEIAVSMSDIEISMSSAAASVAASFSTGSGGAVVVLVGNGRFIRAS